MIYLISSDRINLSARKRACFSTVDIVVFTEDMSL